MKQRGHFCKKNVGYIRFSQIFANMEKGMFVSLPMDEGSKGIRHGGGGANLRGPVYTTVHFSLCNEGSSEYIRVTCVRRERKPEPEFSNFLGP
jgi:hypothetical protein